jgi:hydrogenase maturation factor
MSTDRHRSGPKHVVVVHNKIEHEKHLLHTVVLIKVLMDLKLKLIYDRQSVGQYVLVSGTHLGPATNFYFSLKFSLDSCGFVIL